MADSNITKKALATALKDLLKEQPFDKIIVSTLCDSCHMSRKSFYYHFKDKYDLVNWIFDTEMTDLLRNQPENGSYEVRWHFLEVIFTYFYENRAFYRKVFQMRGQNNFSEHFREYAAPLLQAKIEKTYSVPPDEFTVNFYTEAILCAIIRWLNTKDCMPPTEFVAKIKYLMENSAMTLCKEMDE